MSVRSAFARAFRSDGRVQGFKPRTRSRVLNQKAHESFKPQLVDANVFVPFTAIAGFG